MKVVADYVEYYIRNTVYMTIYMFWVVQTEYMRKKPHRSKATVVNGHLLTMLLITFGNEIMITSFKIIAVLGLFQRSKGNMNREKDEELNSADKEL